MMSMHRTRSDTRDRRGKRALAVWFALLFLSGIIFAAPLSLSADRDSASLSDPFERERVMILKKDLEEEIGKYRKMRKDAEAALEKLSNLRQEKLQNIAKIYESMSAEDAASKLTELDDDIAILILSSLNPRKAGRIMGLMETKKAASLSKKMVQKIRGRISR